MFSAVFLWCNQMNMNKFASSAGEAASKKTTQAQSSHLRAIERSLC